MYFASPRVAKEMKYEEFAIFLLKEHIHTITKQSKLNGKVHTLVLCYPSERVDRHIFFAIDFV